MNRPYRGKPKTTFDFKALNMALKSVSNVETLNNMLASSEALEMSKNFLERGGFVNTAKMTVFLDINGNPTTAKKAVQKFEVSRNFVGANPKFLEDALNAANTEAINFIDSDDPFKEDENDADLRK